MTGPYVGRVEAELRINTSHVEQDVRDGLDSAGRDTEMQALGARMGDSLTEGMARRLEVAGAAEIRKRWLENLAKEIPPVPMKINPYAEDQLLKMFAWQVGQKITGFFQEGGWGNKIGSSLFGGIGKGATNAVAGIGAFGLGSSTGTPSGAPGMFDFSALSSLGGAGAMPAIVAGVTPLVFGALQGVSAFGASITTLPAVIGSLVLQMGTLLLVTHGLMTALPAAFQATDATALQTAIKNLNPVAQQFVLTILPLKDIFHNLETVAQTNFFAQFEKLGYLKQWMDFLGNPVFVQSIGMVATALGQIFAVIAYGMSSPAMVAFIKAIGPATVAFLTDFGQALEVIISGFTQLATALVPAASGFGMILTDVLYNFGQKLIDLANDPAFIDWVNRMVPVLREFGDALVAIGSVVGAFLSAFTAANDSLKAENIDFLNQIIMAFSGLATIIGSPAGIHAIQGLGEALVIVLPLLKYAIGMIVIVLASIDYIYRWGSYSLQGLIGFFDWVGQQITNWFKDRAASLDDFIQRWNNFWRGLGDIVNHNWRMFLQLADDFHTLWHDTIPAQFEDFIHNAPTMLIDAGRKLVQGLINGIKDAATGLKLGVADVAQIIDDYLHHHSPIKMGPLSGAGDLRLAGQSLVHRLQLGMEDAMPALRGTTTNAAMTIQFGAGAFTNNYYGANPATAAQHAAAMYGQFSGALQRDTRLAVRALS